MNGEEIRANPWKNCTARAPRSDNLLSILCYIIYTVAVHTDANHILIFYRKIFESKNL